MSGSSRPGAHPAPHAGAGAVGGARPRPRPEVEPGKSLISSKTTSMLLRPCSSGLDRSSQWST